MYNILDVLLADVFENFIEKSMKIVWNKSSLLLFSLPGYTWKACFKYTQISVEYIKDHKLLLLLENNIRGGNIRGNG